MLHKAFSDIAYLVFREKWAFSLKIIICHPGWFLRHTSWLSDWYRFKHWIANENCSFGLFHMCNWAKFFPVLCNRLPHKPQVFELKFPTVSGGCRKEPCKKAYSELAFSVHIPFFLLTCFVNKHAVLFILIFSITFLIS